MVRHIQHIEEESKALCQTFLNCEIYLVVMIEVDISCSGYGFLCGHG